MGLFHPTGTSRVMSSESNTGSIGTRFQVHAPSSLSTSQGFHPVVTTCPHSQGDPHGFTRLGSFVRRAPGLLRDWLPSQVWTDLEALFPIRSVLLSPAVSPANGRTTLLTFLPSGSSLLLPWGYPQPSQRFYIHRASGSQEPHLPLRGAYPPGISTF